MAKAVAFLELNLTQFDRAIASAQRQLAVLAGAFASFKTVQFFTNHTNEAINFANSLWQVSQQMGKMDVGSLLLSQKALEQIGYSAEGARTRIQELVGAGIPLSVAFGGAKNYAEAITKASEQFGGTASILSRSATQFAVTWDKLQAVAGKFREFFLGMSEQFLRPLQTLLDQLISMDFGGIGARVGDAIAKAVNVLSGLLEGGFPAAMRVFQSGMDFAVATLIEGIKRASDIFFNVVQAAIVTFGGIMDAIDWNTVARKIGDAFSNVIIGLTEAVSLAINEMVPGWVTVESKEQRAKGITDHANEMRAESRRDWGVEGRTTINAVNLQKMVDNVRAASGANSEAFAALAKDIMKMSPEMRAAWEALVKELESAQKRGEELSKNAPGKPGNIGVGKADPFSVVADSLARVGGGGGFIQVGMTMEAKLLIQNNRYAAEQLEQQKILVKNTTKGGSALSTTP